MTEEQQELYDEDSDVRYTAKENPNYKKQILELNTTQYNADGVA